MKEHFEYVNIHTNEIVLDEDAEAYVKEKLGIEIKPVGKFGTMTIDQMEFLENTVDWYFSDEWVKHEVKNELYRIERKNIMDKTITFEDIQKANEIIKTTDIKR